MSVAIRPEDAKEHILAQHADADGWITLAKKEDGQWRQYHYKSNEMLEVLSEWLGEDIYFSQNSFYRPCRRIENIRQLRALYVDVDCYLLNYMPDWVIGRLEMDYFGRKVPEPNLIIFSGRGVVLIWLIEPEPYMALPRWSAVQQYLGDQIKGFGGDLNASDAARVFRLAGSINSKSGELVHVNYRHSSRYNLREIIDEYLPELEPKKQKKGRKSKVERIHTFRVRAFHVLGDLMKYLELRSYDIKGYREVFLYLYRYYKCCYQNDPVEALRESLELNQELTEPLTESEVVRATKSAERAWRLSKDPKANKEAQAKGYPGAGYNYSNEKLIEILGISQEIMSQLDYIIDKPEKNRRDREKITAKRRAAGVRAREIYNQERKSKAVERAEEVFRLYSKGLQSLEIASLTGLSKRRVNQILQVGNDVSL